VCTGLYSTLLYFSFPSFLLVTLHLQSHTSPANTRGQASPWTAPTQQMLMAGVAAMCMRSTLSSGCLGLASPVWVISLWRILLRGKALRAWNKSSVQWRLACNRDGERRKQHQNEVRVWLMSIPVRTGTYNLKYIPVCTFLTSAELCIF
jgi:hypothetical protein